MAPSAVPDNSITRHVQGRIAGRGLGAPCRISVATAKGEVTLSGTVRFPQQKTTAVQAANGVAGVRRVVDRLTVKASAKSC
jgi:osmotically-inducible protein OsmY